MGRVELVVKGLDHGRNEEEKDQMEHMIRRQRQSRSCRARLNFLRFIFVPWIAN